MLQDRIVFLEVVSAQRSCTFAAVMDVPPKEKGRS
jgi:hypothetical protein